MTSAACRLVILALMLLAPNVCGAMKSGGRVSQDRDDPCPNATTTREIERCVGDYLKKTDAELNTVYKRIAGGLTARDRANLIATQRAWLKYRDLNCNAQRVFNGGGGSLGPTNQAFCLRDLTHDRITELIRIYETEGGR